MIIRKVKNVIKKVFKINKKNESEFYTKFFTEVPYWNSPTPNYEESLRWEIIKSFLGEINKHNDFTSTKPNILDLGCGRGWLSKLLSEYGTVIGIEPIKPVVEYAKGLFPKLDLRHGTAKSLINEKKIKFFDIVVCSEVIEHIPDKKKLQFIIQIKKLLKPNGFLILTTPRKDAEVEWRRYGDPHQPIEDWISEKSLEQLFAETKFERRGLRRFSIPPIKGAPEIEIYQLWLVQNL
jgi:2-polyprenyl-3-methyl-5-hydroxy-6-metoxy-1,4-benzoquinol methylase